MLARDMSNKQSEICSQHTRNPPGSGDERNRTNFPVKYVTVGRNGVSSMLLLLSASDDAC